MPYIFLYMLGYRYNLHSDIHVSTCIYLTNCYIYNNKAICLEAIIVNFVQFAHCDMYVRNSYMYICTCVFSVICSLYSIYILCCIVDISCLQAHILPNSEKFTRGREKKNFGQFTIVK